MIIGFVNLIPIVGAYIAEGFRRLLSRISPVKALIFVIFIIILQQVDPSLLTDYRRKIRRLNGF
jgi:predicted PurR-regulated permease PerM